MPGAAGHKRVMVAGLTLAATLLGAVALAQDPAGLPVLAPPGEAPMADAGPGPPPGPLPPTMPAATLACSPGHCHHGGFLGRRACKRRLQEKFLGFPEEFLRPGLGAAVYATQNIQVANGTAARMVLYNYDFLPETDQLNVRGRDKLARIAAQLPVTFFPVVIERSPADPGLAQARRAAVLAELGRGPFPVPAERVVVAAPAGPGQRGIEAELISAGMLGRSAAAGPAVGAGSGPGGFVGATQTINTLGGPR